MSLSHLYSDLSGGIGNLGVNGSVNESEREDVRLSGFEAGYQAGWDDAVEAYQTEKDQAVIVVAQALQDMSFTHREAFLKVRQSLVPVLVQVLTEFFPKAMTEAMAAQIFVTIDQLLEDEADKTIDLFVHEDQLEPLQEVLPKTLNIPFSLKSDPCAKAHQIFLKANEAERMIDLGEVHSGVRSALQVFFEQARGEQLNG